MCLLKDQINMDEHFKALLVILDGWGIGKDPKRSAIAQAFTPVMDHLLKHFPSSTLTTHGESVGLPEGQMGNSEVGHLNIGAGRIVYQELTRIDKYIREGLLKSNELLQQGLEDAIERNASIHVMGLVSDGGVHSHLRHLIGLCDLLEEYRHRTDQVYLHAFLDGRDTDPKSGIGFLQDLQPVLEKSGVRLATVVGRYYAMDRDKRWDRIKVAYDLLVHKKGQGVSDVLGHLSNLYKQGITDEFIPPAYIEDSGFSSIKPDDLVIFFNFRTDRPRQLVRALTQEDMPEYSMSRIPLHLITFTRYDDTFDDIQVLFGKEDLSMTLGEVLENNGKTQLRIAETEKYPHVTFFFSGGREVPFERESRILVDSPKVATYDMQPSMSAPEVSAKVINAILCDTPDFIVLNYANTDMVGHTGDFKAGQQAANCVDHCLGSILTPAILAGYEILIIADHGNADMMINEDGTPNTAHTMNPVPCIYLGRKIHSHRLRDGILADVAPTVLELMGLQKPEAMKGNSLLIHKSDEKL